MVVIKAENIGKRYVIRHEQKERYKTLAGAITSIARAAAPKSKEDFWALDDVSFEINQGERVGIIGRNGAGKSTLLKVLSRIVTPTRGRVEITGRVSSLLEVGTGFHPELSGRENIFLNGSVLGMSKKEIQSKFDEIVDFAEVEKFLDTPVKRYSSGMYVRLAFAVAAHLEPEILIVDEVLAVGDATFQKKCLGKMNDVAGQGRTVLFVSHNLSTVLALCNKGILLENGRIKSSGDVHQVISAYNNSGSGNTSGFFARPAYDPAKHLVSSVELLDKDLNRKLHFNYGEKIVFRIKTNPQIKQKFGLTLKIKNSRQETICFLNSWVNESSKVHFNPGEEIFVELNANPFTQDRYTVDLICNDWTHYHVDNYWEDVFFEIDYCKPGHSNILFDNSKELGNIILNDLKIYSR